MESRKRKFISKEQSGVKEIKIETHISSPKLEDNSSNVSFNKFLADVTAYILPAGIEKTRLEIFKNQLIKNGGHVQEKFESENGLSHIIVDDKMDVPRMLKLMQLDAFPDIPVVKSAWLSTCLQNKELASLQGFKLQDTLPVYTERKIKSNEIAVQMKEVTLPKNPPISKAQQMSVTSNEMSHSTRNPKIVSSYSDSDYEASDDDNTWNKSGKAANEDLTSSLMTGRQVPVEKWICAQSSKNPAPNFNTRITEKLEEMVKAYESTNDKWRAFGYQKAIQALRRHPKEISTWEEAKSLPNVGKRLADKIWEIAQSGELRKLREFESSDDVRVLKLFTSVWGAGPHTAQVWYQQGFRTLADLKEKAHLNHQQEVGVRLFDDLLDRMPREEAAEIEKVVRDAAESIQDGIIAQACGSYRRGKLTCGDVDVLITHPDGKSHKGIFPKLLAKLKESGFLTDDLVSAEENGNQKKYLGVCKLPGDNRKHRRLDIIIVPYEEYGCALVYFTGSAHFNRSLRHLCKKQNMSLNEHALKIGVVRKGGEKIYEGTIIPTPSEESVFQALKIPFRPPEERDH